MVTSVTLRNFYTKAWQPWSHPNGQKLS